MTNTDPVITDTNNYLESIDMTPAEEAQQAHDEAVDLQIRVNDIMSQDVEAVIDAITDSEEACKALMEIMMFSGIKSVGEMSHGQVGSQAHWAGVLNLAVEQQLKKQG